MSKANLDVLVTYSSESESASSRYLADFWPFFDFAAVVVPREGPAALVTGGPESYEFANQFSRIKNIHIHPLFVESSAPDWVPQVEYEDLKSILVDACGKPPRRIGVTDWNIFPLPIFLDLQKAAGNAEYRAGGRRVARGEGHQVRVRDGGHPSGLLDHRAGHDRRIQRGERGAG